MKKLKKTAGFFFMIAFTFTIHSQDIVIDGNTDDWNNVPILSEPGVFPFAKVHVSSNSLNFMVQLSPTTSESDISQVNYVPDSTTIFPNPERGFYKHTESVLGTGNALSKSVLESYRNNESITLILHVYYLSNFKTTSLSALALQEFDADMDILRNAGLKCILRFAYTSEESGKDAALTYVEQHLEQLAPYISKHADVICFMQAGFIGPWGEWHNSSNNLTTPTARAQILSKILENLPEDRMVQVRTPGFKQTFLDTTTPLTQNEAFKSTSLARIGYHNDCFMSSTDDYGTYGDVTLEKAYMNAECLYVPSGGETCPPSGIDPADCTKAQSEMRYLRWTYLNEGYYKGVNDQWIVQGCMDNIKREMGYRFQLISGSYPSKLSPGEAFTARIIIRNLGYAPVYNKRNVELILKNNHTNVLYLAKTDN